MSILNKLKYEHITYFIIGSHILTIHLTLKLDKLTSKLTYKALKSIKSNPCEILRYKYQHIKSAKIVKAYNKATNK